ncbi:unnamed protein product [Polarella glacialis]|uniref:Uncharacterized protein n=1 Tax=Polarella glacialis TaxID=89957 RepID=A0A813FCD1_POLGL|nr:unnamed protein product [Polarella glacialis]
MGSSRTMLALQWGNYLQALKTRPMRTKAVTSFALFGTGSAVAQLVAQGLNPSGQGSSATGSSQCSPGRKVAACAAYGGVLYAPGMHFWYQAVDRWIPSTTLMGTCCKLFLHSTLAAPAIISSFALTTKTLEGCPLEESIAALKERGPKMWLTALGFINVGLFVNYRYMPLPYRVPFGNLVQFVWTMYQSWELYRAQ